MFWKSLEFGRWLTLSVVLVLQPGCRAAEDPRPRDVVPISVDTLRADRLGAYGSSLNLTPNLDALAADSVVFEAAFAPTPFTLGSISGLLTGRYPEEIGVRWNLSVLAPETETLASVLRSHGWRTGAVVSNFVLRGGASGIEAGFDLYDDELPQQERVRAKPERTAEATTRAALGLLDRLREDRDVPSLLWVHYQDPHGPYTPPVGYRRRYLDAERKRPDGRRRLPSTWDQSGIGAIPAYQLIGTQNEAAFYRAGYNGEVRYVDEAIGNLLDGLRARGVIDQTILVFLADHGEGLGENDYWFAHGEHLRDPLVHVPLMIRLPGRPAARRSDVASLLDIVPTLAKQLDLDLPFVPRGRDLLADGSESDSARAYLSTLGESTVLRLGLVSDGYKYLVSLGDGAPDEQLFRVGDEDEELSAREPDIRARLARRLSVLRAGIESPADQPPRPIAPEERDALRALGYLERDAKTGTATPRRPDAMSGGARQTESWNRSRARSPTTSRGDR